jgi:predicted nucleic acid-binding protein
MKESDRLKPTAKAVLEKIDSGELKGIYASVAAIQEIVFWFYNNRLVNDLTKSVSILTQLRNVEWVALTPEICHMASMLMKDYSIGPFDAYHCATAIFRDKVIISTDHVYNKIDGITRIDPIAFVKKDSF